MIAHLVEVRRVVDGLAATKRHRERHAYVVHGGNRISPADAEDVERSFARRGGRPTEPGREVTEDDSAADHVQALGVLAGAEHQTTRQAALVELRALGAAGVLRGRGDLLPLLRADGDFTVNLEVVRFLPLLQAGQRGRTEALAVAAVVVEVTTFGPVRVEPLLEQLDVRAVRTLVEVRGLLLGCLDDSLVSGRLRGAGRYPGGSRRSEGGTGRDDVTATSHQGNEYQDVGGSPLKLSDERHAHHSLQIGVGTNMIRIL